MAPLMFADFIGEIAYPTLTAAGYTGAAVYISHNGRKMPSDAYPASVIAAGGFILPTFEDGANRSASGYQAGRDDAHYADVVMDRWNVPLTAKWAVTSDFPAQPHEVLSYYQGVHDATRRFNLIAYADGDVIRALKAAGLIVGGWLTCSPSFPGSRDLTGVDIHQFCANQRGLIPVPGHSVDTNAVLNPAIGLWGMAGSPTSPGPDQSPHPPAPGELTMSDAATILAKLAELELRIIDVENHVKTIDTRTDRMNHAIGGTTDPTTGAFNGSTTVLGALSPPKS